MPPIISCSKTLARLLSSRSGFGLLRRSPRNLGKSERFSKARGFSSIGRIGNSSIDSLVDSSKEITASESGLFDHLINIRKFNHGPVLGSCDLHFLVDFKFQSPLYCQVASMFFKEVASRLVGSFSDSCHRIHGPGVQVPENAYGQGR